MCAPRRPISLAGRGSRWSSSLFARDQSEGFDRTHIDLPADYVALIEAVAARAPRTVAVLSNGGVVTLEPWHDSVDAIVEGWALGQAVGGALADVPFVHEVRLCGSRGGATGPDAAIARVTVHNSGTMSGADVVQVYVGAAARSRWRSRAPPSPTGTSSGEPGRSSRHLHRRDRPFVGIDHRGLDDHAGRRHGSTRALSLYSTVGQLFGHPVVGPALMQAMMARATKEQLAAVAENENMLKMVEAMPRSLFARFPGVEITDAALEQLVDLSPTYGFCSSANVAS